MRLARPLILVSALVFAGCSDGHPTATTAAQARPTTTATSTPATISPGTTSGSTSSTASTTPPSASARPVTTNADGSKAPCTGAAAPATYHHVVWIWMENHRANQVLGSTGDTPFEHALALECGSTTTYQAVGQPSLPNYLAAITGDIQGVHDDKSPSDHPVTADNLFRQVRAQGGTARSYVESMDGNCSQTSHGRYAARHNPQVYLANPDDHAACLRDDVPLGTMTAGALHDDLAKGQLPTFAFITPDLCNDTHDCDVGTGDKWLSDWVSAITDSPNYKAGDTAIFVVWDEPTPMPMLAVAPSVKPGTTSTDAFDHYSLLRTTEKMLGISDLLGHAAEATGMREAYGL